MIVVHLSAAVVASIFDSNSFDLDDEADVVVLVCHAANMVFFVPEPGSLFSPLLTFTDTSHLVPRMNCLSF